MYLEDQRDAALSSLYLFYCQVTLHVSDVSLTHHQEWHGHVRSEVTAQPWTYFKRIVSLHLQYMTCTSGCNYRLCTPDDG
jgi:hypothetical protein